jgi:hypothetical protein
MTGTGGERLVRIDWQGHACLFHRDDAQRRAISSGALHALVSIALTIPEIDALAIRTDGGQIFCGREITGIGLLADRPARH